MLLVTASRITPGTAHSSPNYLLFQKISDFTLFEGEGNFFLFMEQACMEARPHKETSDVFPPKYRANTLLRIRFSAGVIINTSSNMRLYTLFAMHLLGMLPNVTYLWC